MESVRALKVNDGSDRSGSANPAFSILQALPLTKRLRIVDCCLTQASRQAGRHGDALGRKARACQRRRDWLEKARRQAPKLGLQPIIAARLR
ncbi:hypothetical protein A4R35_06025 [Thermogemmatispora tikiterensis]|uniref:Uncharacterized protein n=1 Tax=Thermogemmatispora tikiterensis TaxID=1825093 RepID=A0A328VLL1_9CHLR|nr:hypothetical protein A4R35_06025 [Thermogemmatispora tikiterensis]